MKHVPSSCTNTVLDLLLTISLSNPPLCLSLLSFIPSLPSLSLSPFSLLSCPAHCAVRSCAAEQSYRPARAQGQKSEGDSTPERAELPLRAWPQRTGDKRERKPIRGSTQWLTLPSTILPSYALLRGGGTAGPPAYLGHTDILLTRRDRETGPSHPKWLQMREMVWC